MSNHERFSRWKDKFFLGRQPEDHDLVDEDTNEKWLLRESGALLILESIYGKVHNFRFAYFRDENEDGYNMCFIDEENNQTLLLPFDWGGSYIAFHGILKEGTTPEQWQKSKIDTIITLIKPKRAK